MDNTFAELYAPRPDIPFAVKYRATCHCAAVGYEVSADPVDAKMCHCATCQTLHGAPMQWAAIFHKHHVRISQGLDWIRFYNSETGSRDRRPPCKLHCVLCGTPIADEGRNMWLAFPALFNFGAAVPEAFRPTCHIFYGPRSMDVMDDLPKWSGHRDKSSLL